MSRKSETCSCRAPVNAYRSLWDGRTNSWTETFVHSTCGLPFDPIWEKYVIVCWECLSEHSAPPGQETCERCQPHLEAAGEVSGPYRGWTEARDDLPTWRTTSSQESSDNLKELLDTI